MRVKKILADGSVKFYEYSTEKQHEYYIQFKNKNCVRCVCDVCGKSVINKNLENHKKGKICQLIGYKLNINNSNGYTNTKPDSESSNANTQ